MSDNPETFVQIGNTLVPGSAAPEDRTFRNAWALDGDAIVIDMEKAREIKKESLRRERKPLLESLDVEYQIADEAGKPAEKKAVAIRKQKLRDITKSVKFDEAETPEELAALTIDDLIA